MTFQFKTIALCTSLCTLMACGGTTIGDDPIIDDPIIDEPIIQPDDPTVSLNQVVAQRNFISDGFGLNETGPIAGVDNGLATYRGQWVSGLTVSGDDEIDGLIGDVNMSINVGGGSYEVGGRIEDLNTLDGNTPLESLEGTLTIDGSIGGFSKEFNSGSGFAGSVSGLFGGDAERTLTVDANMTGGMRDTSGFGNNGSVVVGNTTGTARFVDNQSFVDITTGTFRADR